MQDSVQSAKIDFLFPSSQSLAATTVESTPSVAIHSVTTTASNSAVVPRKSNTPGSVAIVELMVAPPRTGAWRIIYEGI